MLALVNGELCADNRLLQQDDLIELFSTATSAGAEQLDAALVERQGSTIQQRLKWACVGIAGCGGLGSAIAVALARSGVGRLILVDFDRVETSNLNRQHYFADQIGLPKVVALQQNLRRIHPGIHVRSHMARVDTDNIGPLFAQADLLIEAFDEAKAKALLTESWLHQHPARPLVGASGVAGSGPANSIVTRRAFGRFYLCGDGHSEATATTSLMATRVGIAAHHQAHAALRLLLGLDPLEEND
ncbi:MAG: sulfur carrier protein ThiS adenylyltransferase ThiF [Desulfuromonadaceae bacterium]|nr:sulfur carrier protein ThiS adenylyltransferase ThiF [Desulfuromonadaceae bacterium]